MAVLYRKYRPQTFSEVLGQKFIVQTLKNQVEAGQVAHAYLFTGTRGVGKTSIARILAKAVNCTSKSSKSAGDACGKCDSCKQIEAGNFIDLVEIDAASNTGVDNIRDLIEHVKFSPSLAKYKVFIIDEVHMLSKGAFNALLKTLEEPPKHAIFILATTEINKVPPTIISRTQRFDFKRLSAEDLEQHLQNILKAEKIKLPKEAVELAAHNAEGSVRDSLSLLDKIATLGSGATLEECQQLLGITDVAVCETLLGYLLNGQAGELPGLVDNLLEKGVDFFSLNRDFLEYLRKILVYTVTSGKMAPALDGNHLAEAESLAKKTNATELIYIIRLFLKSYKDMATAPSPEVPLLLASLEAAYKKVPVSNNISQSNKDQSPKKPSVDVTVPSPSLKKSQEPEPISAASLSVEQEDTVTLEEAEQVWPKLINELKKVNGPLANLIKTSPVQKVYSNSIVLGVKFLFNKQNLENKKNQDMLGKILKDITGKRLVIRAEVAKEEKASAFQATSEALADALSVFGGELVE